MKSKVLSVLALMIAFLPQISLAKISPTNQSINGQNCIYLDYNNDPDGSGYCFYYSCHGGGSPSNGCLKCDNEATNSEYLSCTPLQAS